MIMLYLKNLIQVMFKKTFLVILLCISLLSLAYTFYKSEIVYNGLRKDYYFLYYIFSILGIFFSYFAFYLKKTILEYIKIIIVSLFFGLFCFEGYLIFIQNLKDKKTQIKREKEMIFKKKTYEKITKKKYDIRSRINLYNELKKRDYTISLPPFLHLGANNKIIPLSGFPNLNTIHCNENGYYSIYKSDRYGFNNPDDEWDKIEIEYLFIGDSFTQGACVERPYDITSKLRMLSGKPALNLGYGGNGPLIEYATLREYLEKNVKKVVWIYFEGNDLDDLDYELKDKTLKKYLSNLSYSQKLKQKKEDIINILKTKLSEQEKIISKNEYSLFKFFKLSKTRKILKIKNEKNLSTFRIILELAKSLAEKNNSKLYFVYIPEFKRYDGFYDDNLRINLKKMINELEIPFIDIHEEVFKNNNPKIFFPFGLSGHFNKEGYSKIAYNIYKLTKN